MDRSVVAPMRFHMSRQVPSRWCSTMCSKPRKYSLTKMRRLFFVQTTTAYIVLPNYCAAWIQIKIINAQHNRHFIMPCYNNVEHIYNFIYVYIYIPFWVQGEFERCSNATYIMSALRWTLIGFIYSAIALQLCFYCILFADFHEWISARALYIYIYISRTITQLRFRLRRKFAINKEWTRISI